MFKIKPNVSMGQTSNPTKGFIKLYLESLVAQHRGPLYPKVAHNCDKEPTIMGYWPFQVVVTRGSTLSEKEPKGDKAGTQLLVAPQALAMPKNKHLHYVYIWIYEAINLPISF